MSGFLTPKENLNLIMKVKERNLLWDRTHVDYKNRTIRDNTWTDIAVTLNQPAELMRNSWNCIRNSHTREYKFSKKFRRRSAWRYYRNLAFLRVDDRLRRSRRESARRHTASQTILSDGLLCFCQKYPTLWTREGSKSDGCLDVVQRHHFSPMTKTPIRVTNMMNLRSSKTSVSSSNASETPLSGSSKDLRTVGAPSNFTFSSLDHTLNSNHQKYSLEARTAPCLSTCMDTEAIEDHNWIDHSRPYSCPRVVSLDSPSNSSIDCKTMESQTSQASGQTSVQVLRDPVRLGGYVPGRVVNSTSEFTLRRSTRDKPSKAGRQQSLITDREHSWQSISATNVKDNEKYSRKRSTLTSLKPVSSSPPRKRSSTKNTQSKVLVGRKNEVLDFCRRNFHPEEPNSGDNTVVPQTKTNDHDYFSSNNVVDIFELISYAGEKLLLLFTSIRGDKERLEFLKAVKYPHTNNDASSEECSMSESRQYESIIHECARTLINCMQEHSPTSNILMNFDEQPINSSKSISHMKIAEANKVRDEGLRIEADEEDRDNPDVEILEQNESGKNSAGDTFNLDEDYHFLLSLYQQMTRLPRHRRIRMRIRIQGMLYDELYSKNVFKEC